MYRNLYRKSSFRSCTYTVLVTCPVRFYSIFDEIGQNVDGKMYFYHKSHCSTIQNRNERQRFQFTCARERICAEKLRRMFFRSEPRSSPRRLASHGFSRHSFWRERRGATRVYFQLNISKQTSSRSQQSLSLVL